MKANIKGLCMLSLTAILCCAPSTIDYSSMKVVSMETISSESIRVTDSRSNTTNFDEDKLGITGSKSFEVSLGNVKLQAIADTDGNVTIIDYPMEWRGQMVLVQFDGKVGTYSPFSEQHCQEIKGLALNGFRELVRNGYHSLLIFDLPVFLSHEFITAIYQSARNAGIESSFYTVKNSVNGMNSHVDLMLSNTSTSLAIGHLSVLNEQLHLGQKGVEEDPLKLQVTVYSGDIICDLISGAAKLTMNYPISHEDRAIKVVYEPLKVKL